MGAGAQLPSHRWHSPPCGGGHAKGMPPEECGQSWLLVLGDRNGQELCPTDSQEIQGPHSLQPAAEVEAASLERACRGRLASPT